MSTTVTREAGKDSDRKHTDESLREERDRTDTELETRSEGAGETADDLIRIRRRLALRQLLALERRATDATLMLERSSVDDTMINRSAVDTIVHDLRSVLSAVSLNAATIVLAADKPEPVERLVLMANHIVHAVAHADVLLGDLQDLATIDDGRARIVRADADVAQVVRTAVEINQAAAAANRIALGVDVPEGRLAASIDAPRFMRVVNNLVTNALKFTPAGGTVAVTCAQAADGVEITVSDTGPGVPAELRDEVFERFRQGRDARGRGLGLGLYIARAIVTAHGGRIWVDDTPGGGATFHVHLPAQP